MCPRTGQRILGASEHRVGNRTDTLLRFVEFDPTCVHVHFPSKTERYIITMYDSGSDPTALASMISQAHLKFFQAAHLLALEGVVVRNSAEYSADRA